MTTIFFLRHGPTKENMEERIQGHLPGTLLVRETEQYLAAVTPLLREQQIDVLLSSDLARSEQTGHILRDFLQLAQLPIKTSPLLRERAMGQYEGRLWREVPIELQAQRIDTDYDLHDIGGESSQDVKRRVEDFLTQTTEQYADQVLCCITHAGWLRQFTEVASREGALPDGWTHRTAIYITDLDQPFNLKRVQPILIRAQLPSGDA